MRTVTYIAFDSVIILLLICSFCYFIIHSFVVIRMSSPWLISNISETSAAGDVVDKYHKFYFRWKNRRQTYLMNSMARVL